MKTLPEGVTRGRHDSHHPAAGRCRPCNAVFTWRRRKQTPLYAMRCPSCDKHLGQTALRAITRVPVYAISDERAWDIATTLRTIKSYTEQITG